MDASVSVCVVYAVNVPRSATTARRSATLHNTPSRNARRGVPHVVHSRILWGKISLPVFVTHIAGSKEAWRAVVAYCEKVLLQKRRRNVSVARKQQRQRRRLLHPPAARRTGRRQEEDTGGDDSSPPFSPPLPVRRNKRRACARGPPSPHRER